MKREEALNIMDRIAEYFGNQIKEGTEEEVFESYFEFIKDYEFNMVMKNLNSHIKRSGFLPKVADLIKEEEVKEAGPYIPSYDDTMFRQYVRENFTEVVNPETLQVVDYLPRVPLTKEQKEKRNRAQKISRHIRSLQMFNVSTPEWEKDFKQLEKDYPEEVANVRKEIENPYELPNLETVNINQLRADQEKGKKKLDEIRKNLQ